MRGVVDHLDENHHVSRPLDDLIVVVVGAGQHRRTGAVHENASHAERLVLHGVGGAAHALSRLRPRRIPLLSFCGHRRQLPIGRIDDQRRAQVQSEPSLVPVEPELREVIVHVGDRARLCLLAFDSGRAS